MNLEEYSNITSEIAQQIRRILKEKAQKTSGKKEMLWAALPKENSDKSIIRFQNQFLGYLRKDNIIEGGLGRLKFANLIPKGDGHVQIGITAPGLEFCLIENPI